MQAAQQEHDCTMFTLLTQFLDRSQHIPQPPFYQAPVQPSQLYNPIQPPPHHSPLYTMASSPSLQFNETSNHPLSFLQDLDQPLPFSNAPPHPRSLSQSLKQAPVNPQDLVHQAFVSQEHPPSCHLPDDEQN